jgi:alpha-glucan,water dikinase
MFEDNARKVKSVIDRIKQALGEVTDLYQNVMQAKAEMMGTHFKADEFAVTLFSEEVLRGTLFFSLSMILKRVDPHVRACANLGDWLIISQGRTLGSRGHVERVAVLADVMHKVYSQSTILLVEKITGEEEVPTNVEAIVVLNPTDYPDVLAHVSVRARNMKALLVCNFNQSTCDELLGMRGKSLLLQVEGSNIKWSEQRASLSNSPQADGVFQNAIDFARTLEAPPMFKQSLIQMNDFSGTHSGAKSNNLRKIRDKLEKSIKMPESACLPF